MLLTILAATVVTAKGIIQSTITSCSRRHQLAFQASANSILKMHYMDRIAVFKDRVGLNLLLYVKLDRIYFLLLKGIIVTNYFEISRKVN